MFVALVAAMLAIPAMAQTGQPASQAPAAPAAQAPAAPVPVSTGLKNAFTTNRNYLAKSAEKMAEADYGMQPGTQTEVRTFGRLIGHVANANYSYCSSAKGEKNPNQGNDFEKLTAKADLVKALNDALAYCDGVYAAQTDVSLMETVQLTMANGRQVQFIRIARLMQNVAHNNEHYGNLVTYFRIKNIVPPSSEPRTP